jgi:hypothetical protein
MLELINATVIFAFGLVITGIVFLGVIQARDQATRAVKMTSPNRSNQSDVPRVA